MDSYSPKAPVTTIKGRTVARVVCILSPSKPRGTEHRPLSVNLLPASPLPTAFQGPSPVRQRKQRQEGGQRLRQGDIYLPGSAGTVSPLIFTHQSRPTGMQGEGQDCHQSAEQGPGPVWLPAQAVVGSDTGRLPGVSIRKLGSPAPLPHPSKGTQRGSGAPGPLSELRWKGKRVRHKGGSSLYFVVEVGERKPAPEGHTPKSDWDTARQQAPPDGWTVNCSGRWPYRRSWGISALPVWLMGRTQLGWCARYWACTLSSQFSSPHPNCSSFPI